MRCSWPVSLYYAVSLITADMESLMVSGPGTWSTPSWWTPSWSTAPSRRAMFDDVPGDTCVLDLHNIWIHSSKREESMFSYDVINSQLGEKIFLEMQKIFFVSFVLWWFFFLTSYLHYFIYYIEIYEFYVFKPGLFVWLTPNQFVKCFE